MGMIYLVLVKWRQGSSTFKLELSAIVAMSNDMTCYCCQHSDLHDPLGIT